jgi:DNA-binding XRE family transcriptional regulator
MACVVASFRTFCFGNKTTILSISGVPSVREEFWIAFVWAFAVETNDGGIDKRSGMRRQNVTGQRVAYLRSQRKWTQKILAAKLQCEGVDISRLSVARIEYGILKANDTVLAALQRIFRVPIALLFPQEIQDLDVKFAQRVTAQSSQSVSSGKPSKCQKLTKRPKRV